MLNRVLANHAYDYLFRRSHFKRSQLDALLVKRGGRKLGIKGEALWASRDKHATVGASQRSAMQAEAVISKSVATLILSFVLGLVSESSLDSIERVAKIIGPMTTIELDDQEVTELRTLIDAILLQASHE